MIMDIFDKDFVRIGKINNYTYVEYEKKYCGFGTFSIKMPLTKENIDLTYIGSTTIYTNNGDDIKKKYILLDKQKFRLSSESNIIEDLYIMGEVLYFKKSKKDNTIEIKGKLIDNLLNHRIIYSRIKSTANMVLTDYVNKLVVDGFTNVVDLGFERPDVFENHNIWFDPPYNFDCPRYLISKGFVNLNDSITAADTDLAMNSYGDIQRSWKILGTQVEGILNARECGFIMFPQIVNSEIVGIGFTVLQPKDLTRTFNPSTGEPINPTVFSKEDGTIEDDTYVINRLDEKTILYGTLKTEGETNLLNSTMSKRIHSYTGHYPDEDLVKYSVKETVVEPKDYQYLIEWEGTSLEYFESLDKELDPYGIEHTYDCTIKNTSSLKFGVDYFLGDKIKIYDSDLEILIDMRITSYKMSKDASSEYLDLQLGTEKITVTEKLIKKGII
jgi:hypothetical protein